MGIKKTLAKIALVGWFASITLSGAMAGKHMAPTLELVDYENIHGKAPWRDEVRGGELFGDYRLRDALPMFFGGVIGLTAAFMPTVLGVRKYIGFAPDKPRENESDNDSGLSGSNDDYVDNARDTSSIYGAGRF